MPDETFGARIERLREAKKLKLKEVGEWCNVGATAVFNWEVDRCKPIDWRSLQKLAVGFGVSIEYLMFGAPE